MSTEQVEVKGSMFLTVVGTFLIVTSLVFVMSDILTEQVGNKRGFIVLLTSLLGGIALVKGFGSFVELSDRDRRYIKAFHDSKEYFMKTQLNVEVVNQLATCGKEKEALEKQLNDCKLEVGRLDKEKVNLQTELTSIKNSFNEYRDLFPIEEKMQDCQSINRVLVIRTKMLSELISKNDPMADAYRALKEKLDLLLLILKGKIPKQNSINGTDFQIQQIMGQKVWGMCRSLKDNDTNSVPTDWQDPESKVRSSGGVEIKGNSPKIDMNMKGP